MLVYPSSMGQVTAPPHHHHNAPTVAFPPSGAVQSHIAKISMTTNTDPNLSVGLGIYPVYYANEMNQTSSCKRSRSLTQRASPCVSFSSTVL
jgi:hypothetical protein